VKEIIEKKRISSAACQMFTNDRNVKKEKRKKKRKYGI